MLRQAFSPELLEIEDFSDQHAHHGHTGPEGESHLHITLVSPALAGLSRVEQYRRVHAVLADDLQGGLHALTLTLRSSQEIEKNTDQTSDYSGRSA